MSVSVKLGYDYIVSMRGANGNKAIESEVGRKFLESFNIYHLYEFCYKIYKRREPQLHRKYSNLFSYIHLMNSRSVLQQKEAYFINHWRRLLSIRSFNYSPHTQELLKLLEIIDEKLKQASLFILFLKDLTLAAWQQLEVTILGELQGLRVAVVSVLEGLLAKEHPQIKTEIKNRIKLVVEDAPLSNWLATRPSQQAADSFVATREEPQGREVYSESNPYLVSSIKFSVKERPGPVKLLTDQQVEALRRQIIQRKKSTTITADGSLKEKESDKATECRQKSQNYNTYHTEISEDSDENSSNSDQRAFRNSNTLSRGKRSGKIAAGKHHHSNFEDAVNLKKMLEAKETQKYNSIHKIEGINATRHPRNLEDPPSRNTIETSSINRFLTAPDNQPPETLKKFRMNKVSIIGKLERTIKKIQVKKLKRPRGGMYFPDDKLKEIEEIYRTVGQADHSHSHSSSSCGSEESHSAIFEEEKDNERVIAQSKRISKLIECSSQKEPQKYKRRFGVSSKAVNSNNSIDWYSIQAKNMADKHKYSELASSTSIFRSSGSNFDEKKSNTKSKYNHHDSNKKMKPNKVQRHQCYDDRDSREFEEMAKKYALSKKSNHRLYTDPPALSIDSQALVSNAEMAKVLTEIHEQDKMDRCGNYEDYYDDVLRRKYEGQSRNSNQDSNQKLTNTFKMENGTEERPSIKRRMLRRDGSLFDYLIKTVKFTQEKQLQQRGISTEQS